EAIRTYLESYPINSLQDCQVRRFLAISYSKLQQEIDKIDNFDWRWLNWFKEHNNQIVFAISFNYDLLLENTLKDLNVLYFRTSTTEPNLGIPIFKPHGSIDFELYGVHIGPEKIGHTLLD